MVGLSLDVPACGHFAWLALAPVLHYQRVGAPALAAKVCAAFIVVSFAILLHPVAPTTPFGYALILVVSGALYGGVAYLITRVFGGRHWSPLGVALVWLWVESLKSYLGMEWGSFGYTQWSNPVVLSLASVIGSGGVSLLVWFVNAYLAMVVGKLLDGGPVPHLGRWAGVLLVLAAATLFHHASTGLDVGPSRTLEVIAVPGHYSGDDKLAAVYDVSARKALLSGYLSASAKAAQDSDAPSVIVWPESAIPVYADRGDWLKKAFEEIRLPDNSVVLLGAVGGDSRLTSRYNSAYLVTSSAQVLARYDKRWLTPFFEYQPIPWLWRWVFGVDPFLPGWEPFTFEHGTRPGVLDLPQGPIGVHICFEESFAAGFREQVAAGAQLLFVLSSYAAFDGGDLSLHTRAFSRFRAVETGRWLVRSTNLGTTSVIDPQGRLAASLSYPPARDRDDAESLRASVALRTELTPYVRWGHRAIYPGSLSVLGASLAWRLRRDRKFSA